MYLWPLRSLDVPQTYEGVLATTSLDDQLGRSLAFLPRGTYSFWVDGDMPTTASDYPLGQEEFVAGAPGALDGPVRAGQVITFEYDGASTLSRELSQE